MRKIWIYVVGRMSINIAFITQPSLRLHIPLFLVAVAHSQCLTGKLAKLFTSSVPDLLSTDQSCRQPGSAAVCFSLGPVPQGWNRNG